MAGGPNDYILSVIERLSSSEKELFITRLEAELREVENRAAMLGAWQGELEGLIDALRKRS